MKQNKKVKNYQRFQTVSAPNFSADDPSFPYIPLQVLAGINSQNTGTPHLESAREGGQYTI